MKNKFPNYVIFIIAALVIAMDQASKYWILNIINLEKIGFIDLSPIFDLTMVWNYGVSFGILRANSDIARYGLIGFTAIISLIFLFWALKSENKLGQISLALIIGGAIGNMIDRIRFGAVADFLDFSGLFFPWVFNIADCGVVIGAALLALDLFLNDDEKAKTTNLTE